MKRMPALGRKLPHAGEVSSNPRPHQKKEGRQLSELVKQSLLPRQQPLLGAFFTSFMGDLGFRFTLKFDPTS